MLILSDPAARATRAVLTTLIGTALALPVVSRAETVTWQATGTLTSVDVTNGAITEFPTANVGTAFTLTFVFDSSSAVSVVNDESDFGGGVYFGTRYRYYDALVSIRLEIDGGTAERAFDGFGSVDLYDNFAWNVPPTQTCYGTDPSAGCDGFVVLQGVESSVAGGFAQLSLILRGPEHRDIFAGPGLPTQPSLLLTDLSDSVFQFFDQFDSLDGIVESVVAVNAMDTDSDGISDTADNCIEVANPDQRDTNGDCFGNACDPDLNDDCTVNFADLGALKAVFFSADPDADLDGNGAVNFTDLGVMKEAFFMPPGPSGATSACDRR